MLWSKRLVAVDPWDPITWRTIAESTAQCGLTSASHLAFAGMVALGAPGAHRTINMLSESVPRRASTMDADAEGELTLVLRDQLRDFFHAE